MSSDGTYVWVANFESDSVTELLASTGALVQVLSGSDPAFIEPYAVASDGVHVWLTSFDLPFVTELTASSVTGKVLTGP